MLEPGFPIFTLNQLRLEKRIRYKIYRNISKVGILIYWFIGIKIREQRIQRINTWIKTMSYKYLGKHKGYASPRWAYAST